MTVAEVLDTLSDMLSHRQGRDHTGPCDYCVQQEKEARALYYAIELTMGKKTLSHKGGHDASHH